MRMLMIIWLAIGARPHQTGRKTLIREDVKAQKDGIIDLMNSVADLFAQYLLATGIKTVFGLPGGASLPILAALQRQGINFVLVRNESSAVYMAEVTARLTGKPGVCIVTLGPGAANAMAGVANAYLDRSPLLIVTADFPDNVSNQHTHQLIDLAAMMGPVTKGSTRLHPDHASQQIRDALELAQTGRPGPVHLNLAGAYADQPTEMILLPGKFRIGNQENKNNIQKSHNIIKGSKRPIIVTGLGLEPDRPYPELRELAETLQAPLIDTPKGKGALPASHPLFAGTIGLMQTDPPYELLNEADCIIAVGFDVVELVRIWDYDVPLIWVSNWENENPIIPAEASLVGLIKVSLRQLIDSEHQIELAWGETRVKRFRDKLASRQLPSPPAGRLFPQQLIAALHEAAPATVAISTDVGSHKILSALEWPAESANRYFVSNGLSAMGFGLPAALAASLALGETAICITGDAGFSMVIGELSLIQEHQLTVIVIVMNDAALDLIRSKQLRRDEPIYGTQFHNPDFASIAQAYELPYFRADSESKCKLALETALASNRSALIEVLIDPTSYPTSPTQPGTP